jgi:hypothetical protein
MGSTRKPSQVFNNNPQGRQPNNRWCNCVQTDVNRSEIKNKNRGENKADWEKSTKEAKVRIGVEFHLRRRRRRRRIRRRRKGIRRGRRRGGGGRRRRVEGKEEEGEKNKKRKRKKRRRRRRRRRRGRRRGRRRRIN